MDGVLDCNHYPDPVRTGQPIVLARTEASRYRHVLGPDHRAQPTTFRRNPQPAHRLGRAALEETGAHNGSDRI